MSTRCLRWVLFVTSAGLASAADSPGWGHPLTRNMVYQERGLAETFNAATGANILWTAELGDETYSPPIIANGRVLIGTNNRHPRDKRHTGDRGVLYCLDEKTGAFCWQLIVPKMEEDIYLDWPGAGICSPAAVEGERVYIVSNRGELMCLDLNGQANGNDGPYLDEARHAARKGSTPVELTARDADIIWLLDLFGPGIGIWQHDSTQCSVLIDGEFLYANTSNGVDNTHRKIRAPDAPALIVVEKKTGRLVARDNERCAPRTIHSTWSSPSVADVNGKRLVFFGGPDAVVYAFDALKDAPPAGQVVNLTKVWQFDCDPAAPKDDVLKWQDNRREGPSTIIGMPVFCDGRVYVTSGGDPWHGKPECWLWCLDAATGKEVWKCALKRFCMSTPAVANGLVFIGDWGRTLHCVDAATGKECWTHELRGEAWGSPFVADGKVHLGDRGGTFWILAAERERRIIADCDCGSAISVSGNAANGLLFVPTMRKLFAIKRVKDAALPE
jgi:outer membrane protein assembly factor BamB